MYIGRPYEQIVNPEVNIKLKNRAIYRLKIDI